MWQMTSNDVRAKWAAVLNYVQGSGGIVWVRKWSNESVAVVPADWARQALDAIGPPKAPEVPTEPPKADR